jgi:hypothetical protein
MAVIIQDGLRRMYENGEDAFYYITMYNEDYAMPAIPEGEGIREGILRGIYKFKAAENGPAKAQLLWQRPHPQRGIPRATNPRREVQRRRRCLERDQLQRAAARLPQPPSVGTASTPQTKSARPLSSTRSPLPPDPSSRRATT